MSVRFLGLELAKWDQEKGGDLVLSFFKDERPLRGAAGLADWRLCGKLSHLLRGRRLDGDESEALLLPPGRRLPFDRVMVFGLGERRGYGVAEYRRDAAKIAEVLSKAKSKRYAIQPPGRAMGLVAARKALQIWIEVAAPDPKKTAISIIDTPHAQKEMAEILSGQALG